MTMWIASYVVHVKNTIMRIDVYVGSVTKKKISQSTYPKDGIMVLGNVSAWHVQAARNAPPATVRDTTAALPKKSGKRMTETGYVWNVHPKNAQVIAKSC